MKKSTTGFTIIELLIVIVVIAVLAVISVAAYNGMQQRSRNSAIIAAAKNSLSAINAYVAIHDAYPGAGSVNSSWCITTSSGCRLNNGNVIGSSAFSDSMSDISALPREIPMKDLSDNGVIFSYYTTRTYAGELQPAMLVYALYGVDTSCGLPNVASGWVSAHPSTSGYSVANINASGNTLCYIHIPGPNT